ncbi:MAG TPA: enoyl-CoA hydratase [Balneolaceae bacterium]|nr:enoyl-CoA hydratase [Balneolaceae bacterium]|tara:strand:- start:230175 stop:230951 length:777 start_codon:yes stop_codon:yes gene_type:complete
MKNFETLLWEQDGSGVGVLTINRPKAMNALNDKVFVELQEFIDTINNDQSLRALIITGTGDKAFVAGADIKEFADFSSEEATKLSLRGQNVFQQIEELGIPVIAAVNGYALGGGLEFALACHIRIASPNAVLGLPEVSLGLIPGYGGTQRLPQIVGKAKALEMIMSGRFVKAEEALSIGLVSKIAEGDILEEARGMVKPMLKQAPLAITKAIEAVKESGKTNGFEHEANLFGDLFSTADFKEGTQAFIEKRKPEFQGK